jgi:hypothetical protein
MKIAILGLIALASTLLISCGGADRTAEPLVRAAAPSAWAACPDLRTALQPATAQSKTM